MFATTSSRSVAAHSAFSMRGLFARIQTLRDVARQRSSLRTLDAHLLNDIGLTRFEALSEAERPIWDTPNQGLSA